MRVELLAATSEQLTENTLFNIVVFPDTWSEGVNQEFVELRVFGEFFELSDLLFGELDVVLLIDDLIHLFLFHYLILFWILLFIIIVPLLVRFDVPDHINVGFINVFKGSHVVVHSHSLGSVDTDYFHSVTGLYEVN